MLVAVVTTSNAQVLKLGIMGGANRHTLEFNSVSFGSTTISEHPADQYGYQLGAVLRISLPDFIQIQTELIYQETSSRLYVNNGKYTTNTSMSMNSFEVPIMIGFNIKAFRVFAGPVFRLSSSMDFSQKYNSISASVDDDNIGLQGGFGFDIGKFFIDARYSSYSEATKIDFNVNGDKGTVKSTKDGSWQLNLGLFF